MASDFEVKIKETKGISFSTVYKTLEAGNQSLKIVSDALRNSSYASIRTTLTKVVESNTTYIASVKQMDSVLDLVVEQYEKTENDILGKKIEDAKAEGKDSSKFDWKLNNLVFNVVGKVGTGGIGLSAIGKSAVGIYQGYKEGDNGKIYKGLLDGGKGFVLTVGELANNAYKDVPDWKETVLGNWKKGSALTEIAKKTNNATTFSGTLKGVFKSELDGYIPSSSKNVGQNVKVGAKWAGVAISGVANGINNYKEHGGLDNGRFWAETITETAVDVVTTAAATAAVSAAMVALGVSAPAVAVGAAAAGVVWAVDAVTRFATKKLGQEEKGFTEFVSDTVLDAGEAVIDMGKKAVTGISNAVSTWGNSIGTKWRLSFG